MKASVYGKEEGKSASNLSAGAQYTAVYNKEKFSTYGAVSAQPRDIKRPD